MKHKTHHLAQTRKPVTCKCCRTIMYPGPSGAAENHKQGYCSDGVKQTIELTVQNEDPPRADTPKSCTLPEWPQPQGIFTDGIQFHLVEFLNKIREMYEKVVIEKQGGDMILEHVAFASLLARRTVQLEDGAVLFKLLDLGCPPSTLEGLIIIINDKKYLCLDCLQEPSSA
jgi:hypothetical protein